MKRTMTALLILVAAAPAHAEERRFSVTDFDRIQIDGPFQVALRTGGSPSAAAIGTPAAIDRVSVAVENRTLRVRPNGSAWGGYPGEGAGPVRILLSTHGLRSANVIGSGSLEIDRVEAMRFDIALSGSGRIAVGEIEADSLNVGLVGAGTISLAGAAKDVRATVQGSGELQGADLIASDARINSDTSGTVAMTVRGTAHVVATGAGDTTIAGSPACTVEARGSGLVACGRRR